MVQWLKKLLLLLHINKTGKQFERGGTSERKFLFGCKKDDSPFVEIIGTKCYYISWIILR